MIRLAGPLVASTVLAALLLAACSDLDAGKRAYERGDYDRAFRKLLPVAQQGDPDALFLVGRMYHDGHGVAADPGEAARWYRYAARKGHTRAQYNLGSLYLTGLGVLRFAFGSSEWPDREVLVVARDRRTGLVLLRTWPPAQETASFREGRGVERGDPIVAPPFSPLPGRVGGALPYGLPELVTGRVGARLDSDADVARLQITAPIEREAAGGPVLDQSGNVIGIVAERGLDVPSSTGFAIDASAARAFLDAHGVAYQAAPSTQILSAAEVWERAKRFTVHVACIG